MRVTINIRNRKKTSLYYFPCLATTMFRFLLIGMVASVSVSALLLLSYGVMFDSTMPSTLRVSRYDSLKSRTGNEEYPVLVGSAIESQFTTLEVSNCSSDLLRSIQIEWNNKYWQKVDDGQVYLYSAFYDVRFVYQKVHYHYIRILGMALGRRENKKYYCTMWYTHLPKPITVEAQAQEIWLQHWDRNPQPNTHFSYMFSCPIPLEIRDKGIYPDHVSLSSQMCKNITNKLPVKKDGFESLHYKAQKQFAVCVKGMNFEKDLSIRLVEWLELLFMLGADKVYFYKYSVHENMEKVLKYYEKQGKVKVVLLTLPGDQPNDPDLRTSYLKRAIWQKRRNEIVPYNDCLYRNIYLYEYVLPLDIDEVIMPVKHSTWSSLIRDYRRENPQVFEKFCSLSAQNTYFLEVYNSTHNPTIPPYYHILQNKLRSANFSLYGHSVKSFVSTRLSKTVFNHYTLDSLYLMKKTNHVMNSSYVQMNHYKDRCPRDIYSQCQSKFLAYVTKDYTTDRYEKRLVKNVENVIGKLRLPFE